MNDLTIAGVEIVTDAEGRFNLNALHRAYEAHTGSKQPNKAPAQWQRTKQAQELISEVEKQTMQTCIVSNEGRNGGTFAHELAAVEYAGWISPSFRIQVNRTFIDYRTGKLTAPPGQFSNLTLSDTQAGAALLAWTQAAAILGVPVHYAQIESVKAVNARYGVDFAPLLTHSPAMNAIVDDEEMLEPTELAARFGLASGKEMNTLLREAGLQRREHGQWVPTDLGAPLCAKHAWVRDHKSGYNLKWKVSAVRKALRPRIVGGAS